MWERSDVGRVIDASMKTVAEEICNHVLLIYLQPTRCPNKECKALSVLDIICIHYLFASRWEIMWLIVFFWHYTISEAVRASNGRVALYECQLPFLRKIYLTKYARYCTWCRLLAFVSATYTEQRLRFNWNKDSDSVIEDWRDRVLVMLKKDSDFTRIIQYHSPLYSCICIACWVPFKDNTSIIVISAETLVCDAMVWRVEQATVLLLVSCVHFLSRYDCSSV